MNRAISVIMIACAVLGLAVACGGKGEAEGEAAEAIAAAPPAFQITAKKLYDEYEADDGGSSTKYLEKVIVLTGVVAEVGVNEGRPYLAMGTGGVLDLGLVSCIFPKEAAQVVAALPAGKSVKVKGKVVGRASFAEIRLQNCILQ